MEAIWRIAILRGLHRITPGLPVRFVQDFLPLSEADQDVRLHPVEGFQVVNQEGVIGEQIFQRTVACIWFAARIAGSYWPEKKAPYIWK